MLNKIIEAALITAFSAAAVGKLPDLLQTVEVAQFQILKDSESKKWGRPFLLPVHHPRSVNSRRGR